MLMILSDTTRTLPHQTRIYLTLLGKTHCSNIRLAYSWHDLLILVIFTKENARGYTDFELGTMYEGNIKLVNH